MSAGPDPSPPTVQDVGHALFDHYEFAPSSGSLRRWGGAVSITVDPMFYRFVQGAIPPLQYNGRIPRLATVAIAPGYVQTPVASSAKLHPQQVPAS